MKRSSADPGLIVSGAGHVALLVLILVGFSHAAQFEDAQESIPVQMVTDQQFAEIMKGVKTEKEVKPHPFRVDKVADITEAHRAPPIDDAKADVPARRPHLRPTEDPIRDAQPQPAPPTPPQRPVELAKAETKSEPPPKPDADAILPPKPPPRRVSAPKRADVAPPLPPVRPAHIDRPKPKPTERLKLDQVAKLIAATQPKRRKEAADSQPLNLTEVSQLLAREPDQKASTGRELSRTASLGSPTASAPKMSPSLWGQLDGLIVAQYKRCWDYLGLNDGDQYIPEIEVEFTPDGALAAKPLLRNPPSDPGLQSLADSAMRAVEECNPLKIPAQYAPYYNEWKSRILRFDPEEMAG